MLHVKPLGRPPHGNYQCFAVKFNGTLVAYITVYDDGHRYYEFDNQRKYATIELNAIMEEGERLDSRYDANRLDGSV